MLSQNQIKLDFMEDGKQELTLNDLSAMFRAERGSQSVVTKVNSKKSLERVKQISEESP